MKKFCLFPLIAAFLGGLLTGCTVSESSDNSDAFSVQFNLASVPQNLTMDSLEIRITVGDTGTPKAFTIDMSTGVSRAKVMAYPGQKYALTFVLYASGFEIGTGQNTGTLTADMRINIQPVWNLEKIESAKAARATGKLLPTYLGSAFDQALAGKPIRIVLDSAVGHIYTWYVRLGDSVLASGSGVRIEYTPADSLGGTTVNVKVVVKKGTMVVEERTWDINVFVSLSADRLVGIITRPDTATHFGTYARIVYDGQARYDSILIYDTTALVVDRAPVATLAYTYATGRASQGDPSRVVRAAVNQPDLDSTFVYDSRGRLVVLTAVSGSDTIVDSLAYLSENLTVTRSLSRGRLVQEVRQVSLSDRVVVDSIYSPGDSGLVPTGLIRDSLEGGKVVNRRVFRKYSDLAPNESQWTQYNGLGAVAIRKHYTEGQVLILEKTEVFSYRSGGLLDRMVERDEDTGELLTAVSHVYQAVPLAKRGSAVVKAGSGPSANRARLLRLGEIGRLFPKRPGRASSWTGT